MLANYLYKSLIEISELLKRMRGFQVFTFFARDYFSLKQERKKN